MLENASSASGFWQNVRMQLGIVCVAALLVRLVFVFDYGPILTNDSYYYLSVANNVLDGKGFGMPYRAPPMYASFLAGVLALSSSHWAIIVAQALLGSLTCVILASACRHIFQPKVALVLGLAVALFIPMAAFCVAVLRETMIGFAVALTTYCLVRSLQYPNPRWIWATGLATTFTVFNQPTFLLLLPWLGLAHWVHSRSFLQAVRRVWPVVACIAAAIGLWATRNYFVTGRFIPLSADHIGYFFLEGIMDANENDKSLTPEQIQYLGVEEHDPYNTYAGMRDHYWAFGEGDIAASLERKLEDGPILLHRGLKLVAYEPGKYLWFSLKRLHRLWCKDLWVAESDPDYLNLRPLDAWRASANPAAWFVVVIIYAFGYAAVIGITLFWRPCLGLLVPAVTMLSFHMWVHAETRYALAIHPHLLIFSVLAVIHLWHRVVSRQPNADIKRRVLKSDDDLQTHPSAGGELLR